MMTSPSLNVLDVGHGSCAVLVVQQRVAVFDGARGGSILDFLEERKIDTVDAVFISHADDDHIAGVITLLLATDICVKALYMNPDAAKRTKVFRELRHAIHDAQKRSGTRVYTSLTNTFPKSLNWGSVEIEVLAPSPRLAMSGAGGEDLSGRKLDSNSMSAVMRILKDTKPVALIPGDLDDVGLASLAEDCPQPCADILIYPHHGGLPGAVSPVQFAKRVCALVRPRAVLFSIAGNKHGTPHPRVIRYIRKNLADVHIACTQVSRHCARRAKRAARGATKDRPKAIACAGTIVVDLSQPRPVIHPDKRTHASRIEAYCGKPLCR